uniref:DUF629 domain-containing protein n=1 Tax=Oryza brachyantha TaxID=4533 RepID=J3N0W0_ORYBR
MEAREVLMLDRNGRRDEAIARAHELVDRQPASALVARLAAGLHYDSTTRAIAAKDKEGITKNCNAARDLYLHAQRLAPNCVEITARLAGGRAIPFPCDPAENNVAYDLMPENTPKARVENAKKWATERHQRILSCVRNKTIPEYVRSLIEYAGSHGVANAIQPVREFAERYSYSVRAPLTNAYINLEFARGLAPGIDKRQFLSRILRELNSVANQFETSLVLAMVRTKLLFVLGLYTAMASEYVRAMDIESPPDPQFEDIPPGSVRGDKHEDRISSIRTELVSLQQKLLLIARDYWSSLTRGQQRGVLSAGFNSMHQYYVRVYDDSHEAAKTISDALSFVKKNRSWRYWICPYCVGKKIPDTDALLKHMHKKHSEGSVWPKLLSVLDPKLIPDTSQGERFSDDATLCQDPDEHYVFHFKRVRPSSINQPMPFSEIRGNKCTEGVEILEKIKLKLKNAPADVLSTKERFLQCIGDDKKVASKSVDAADIDAVFPYVGDTPEIDEMFLHVDDALDENAADNDAIRPQVPDAPDSNVANIDTILPNVVDTSNSDAASDSVCPNPGDIPDNSAANIDGICLSTLNTAGVPNRNAADNDVIHPNVPDASDSNVANIDAILPNVVDTSNRNAADDDAIRPNVPDASDCNVANIDGILPNIVDASNSNAASDAVYPNTDRNAADNDAICPNIPDASDSKGAHIDAILPNVVDAFNSNAANDAVCPDSGDVPDNNAANIDEICLNTLNTAGINDRNTSDNDAVCPNVGDALDSKAADIDAKFPNVANAPDRNFGVKDCSNFSHENEAQKYEVNEKPENIMFL